MGVSEQPPTEEGPEQKKHSFKMMTSVTTVMVCAMVMMAGLSPTQAQEAPLEGYAQPEYGGDLDTAASDAQGAARDAVAGAASDAQADYAAPAAADTGYAAPVEEEEAASDVAGGYLAPAEYEYEEEYEEQAAYGAAPTYQGRSA